MTEPAHANEYADEQLVRLLARGRSRPLGAAMLIAVLLLSAQFPDLRPLRGLRLSLFDTYQQVFPRERASAPAIVVAIDEDALRRYGQWPWPRPLLARMLNEIGKGRPAAIGLDLLLSEPERGAGQQLADLLPDLSPHLRRRLASVRNADAALADTIKHLPIVLGIAGLEEHQMNAVMRGATFMVRGDLSPHIRRYAGALTSLPALASAAKGQGVISVDIPDGVVRRVPMVVDIDGVLMPSLSLELLRVAAGADYFELQASSRGLQWVKFAEREVPLESDGSAWLHFGPADPNRTISAASVLAGQAQLSYFEGKVVLVGLTGVGLQDTQATPLRTRMPGVAIHQQLVETLFDGHVLLRNRWCAYAERVALLAAGLLLIWLVPRWRPPASVALFGSLIVVLLAAGFVLFDAAQILLDVSLPTAGATLVFGVLLTGTLADAEMHRRQLRRQLATHQQATTRMAAELEAARRIQLAILPPTSAAFLDDARFTLHALMEPAREVGGDLYDFFKLDRDRLFFLVGDVSGKGLPASIFMAVSKALYKSVALRLLTRRDAGLGEVMRTANAEVSRDNPGLLFVTMFAGVLDLVHGRLEYCNAGHDLPAVLSPRHAAAQRLEHGRGPPLCALDDFAYTSASHTLMPGETLVVVTDGVPEAMDANERLYGRQRLLALLESIADSQPVSAIAATVQEDVRRFVGKAEPSDDLAVLVLRWNGTTTTSKLSHADTQNTQKTTAKH